MKILKGSLVENLYDWPNPEVVTAPHETAPHETTPKSVMTLRKTTVLGENDVAYMSDKVWPFQAQRKFQDTPPLPPLPT